MKPRLLYSLTNHKGSSLAVGLFLFVSDFAAIGISFVIASRVRQVLFHGLVGDIFSPACRKKFTLLQIV